MKTVITRAEIILEDESGYHFTILAELREGRGWKAQASLGHHHSGAATREGVLSMLLDEAQQFVRMLANEVEDKVDG